MKKQPKELDKQEVLKHLNDPVELISQNKSDLWVEATGWHIANNNEMMANIRNFALEIAKQDALEFIGTYIESESSLKNGKLIKHDIKTIAGTVLKTKVLDNKVIYINDQINLYKFRVLVMIDQSEFQTNMKRIKNNLRDKKKIVNLQKENEELTKKLNQSSLDLLDKLDTDNNKKQNDLLASIIKNNQEISNTFEKGLLAKRVNQQKQKDKLALDDIKIAITYWLKHVNERKKVNIGKIKQHDGKVDIYITSRWNLAGWNSTKDMQQTLKKYFFETKEFGSKRTNFGGGHWNIGKTHKKNHMFSDSALEQFLKTRVSFKHCIGKYCTSQDIIGKGLFGEIRFYIVSDIDNDYKLAIKNIPESYLENIDSIQTEINLQL